MLTISRCAWNVLFRCPMMPELNHRSLLQQIVALGQCDENSSFISPSCCIIIAASSPHPDRGTLYVRWNFTVRCSVQPSQEPAMLNMGRVHKLTHVRRDYITAGFLGQTQTTKIDRTDGCRRIGLSISKSMAVRHCILVLTVASIAFVASSEGNFGVDCFYTIWIYS